MEQQQSQNNQKKSSRFKSIGMILGILLISSLAFAGVVAYLSNSVQANVTVSSPMTMTIDGGPGPVSTSIFGGETFEFSTVGKNNANTAVIVYPTTFTLSAGSTYVWNGTEITNVNLVDRGTDKGNVLPYLYIVNDDGTRGPLYTAMTPTTGDIRVMVDETPGDGVFNTYSHPAGSAIDNNISATFSAAVIPGTYAVTAQQLFSLVK